MLPAADGTAAPQKTSAPTLFDFGVLKDPWRDWVAIALPLGAGEAGTGPLLAVIEDPQLLLAAALLADEPVDPAAVLASWRQAAQRLLREVQRNPLRAMLADATEVRLHAAEFVALCRERWGLPSAGAPPAPPATVVCNDALVRALAERLWADDAQARGLAAELQASCVPLGPAAAPVRLAVNGSDVWQGYVAMRKAAAAAAGLSARCQQAEARLASLAREQAQWVGERGALQSTVQSLRAEAARATQAWEAAAAIQKEQAEALRVAQQALGAAQLEARLHALQFQQLQEEFDAGHPALVELTAVREQLALQTRLGASLQSKLVELTRRNEAAALEGSQLATELLELRSARTALATAQQSIGALQAERTHVQAQLHDARQQLHDLEQRWQAQPPVPQAPPPAPATPLPPSRPWPHDGTAALTLEGTQVVSEHIQAPHRGLSLVLRAVAFGSRHVPELQLRLVEHMGRPGLVVFRTADLQRLFSRWHETGIEREQSFTFFMPSDDNYGASLDALGATDWLLLRAIVAHLVDELGRSSGASHAMWAHVARRLDEQLHDLPPRLRCDVVHATADTGAASPSMLLRMDRVSCAGRTLPRLALHWQLENGGSRIEVANDADTGPPMMDWPMDAQGRLADRLALPLSAVAGDATLHKRWLSLQAKDRLFILGLLTAWPDIVAKLPEPALEGANTSRAALTAASVAMLQDVTRASQLPLSPVHWLRRRVTPQPR